MTNQKEEEWKDKFNNMVIGYLQTQSLRELSVDNWKKETKRFIESTVIPQIRKETLEEVKRLLPEEREDWGDEYFKGYNRYHKDILTTLDNLMKGN